MRCGLIAGIISWGAESRDWFPFRTPGKHAGWGEDWWAGTCRGDCYRARPPASHATANHSVNHKQSVRAIPENQDVVRVAASTLTTKQSISYINECMYVLWNLIDLSQATSQIPQYVDHRQTEKTSPRWGRLCVLTALLPPPPGGVPLALSTAKAIRTNKCIHVLW